MEYTLQHPNTCFRALDFKYERSDGKIIHNLEQHLQYGVLSRRERYGEVLWRILSGYFRQPQWEIYVWSPKEYEWDISSLDIKWYLDWFDRKYQWAHRAYLALSVPHQIDTYKQRSYCIPDDIPREERIIKGVILRSWQIHNETLTRIQSICQSYPFLSIFEI